MMPEPTVARLQAWGRERLSGEDARRESELLLGHALQRERAWLFAHANDAVDVEVAARFEAFIARRAEGVPVAQLIGAWGFWTLTLHVTPDTLIPRPETELLVEAALARLVVPARAGTPVPGTSQSSAVRDHAAEQTAHAERGSPRESHLRRSDGTWRIADLGTGTGAIALALASERPTARVIATDACSRALDVARANAQRNDIANVEFRAGDWYAPLRGERFDLIASNPPYIADADPHLQRGDLRFEPRGALASGADGLDAIRVLAAGARAHLAPDGWLLLEHGFQQGAAVRGLFHAAGLQAVQTLQDLEQRDRVTAGRAP